MCMLYTCLILVIVLIGLVYGFRVLKDGFQKLKDTIHDSHHLDIHSRPFLKGFNTPPPL
ncbi:hypothetical protein LINPERPRIM_LOCUS25174 [Linum perenne]